MNNKTAPSVEVFPALFKGSKEKQMLQSGDQVGTKEMSEGKQLSPPPETLLALFNLPLYECLIWGEPDSLE